MTDRDNEELDDFLAVVREGGLFVTDASELEPVADAIKRLREENADLRERVYKLENNIAKYEATDPVVQECIDALTEDPDVETPVLDSDRDQTLADHEMRIKSLETQFEGLNDRVYRIATAESPPNRVEFEELCLEVQELVRRFNRLDMAMKGAMQAADERNKTWT